MPRDNGPSLEYLGQDIGSQLDNDLPEGLCRHVRGNRRLGERHRTAVELRLLRAQVTRLRSWKVTSLHPRGFFGHVRVNRPKVQRTAQKLPGPPGPPDPPEGPPPLPNGPRLFPPPIERRRQTWSPISTSTIRITRSAELVWRVAATAKDHMSRSVILRSGLLRSVLRVFVGYENRWELLNESTDDVPVLLPSRLREWALRERVGLPPGHPWRESLPSW